MPPGGTRTWRSPPWSSISRTRSTARAISRRAEVRGRPSSRARPWRVARATVELPEGCEFSAELDEIACTTAQPLSWAAADRPSIDPGGGPGGAKEAIASAREFLRALRETRRATSRRDGERVLEPLGVTVSFEAVVAGYRGEQLDVRWSLHRTGSDKPISRDWLANRRVPASSPRRTRSGSPRSSGSHFPATRRRRTSA